MRTLNNVNNSYKYINYGIRSALDSFKFINTNLNFHHYVELSSLYQIFITVMSCIHFIDRFHQDETFHHSDNLFHQFSTILHNTTYICSKARKKLWLLRRLQPLGLSTSDLFDVYVKEIRSILEYAVPVWHFSITKKEASEIEEIQKIAFRMILGQSYRSYVDACAQLGTVSLKERRLTICQKFTLKNVKSDNCLFRVVNSDRNLRKRKNLVHEYKCNTARFQKSSLPSLAKLANANST